MTAVEPLEHTAVQTLDFDPAEYVRKVFGMYPDNLCTVELLCDNEVMRSVIDRFGENVQTETVDEQHFRATVEVAPSPPFFSWIFTFGGKIRIISPLTVLEEMRQRDYNDSHRAAAPLKQAEDAVLLDTTELDFRQSEEAILRIILERTSR